MNKPIDLEQLERKAFLSFHQDGVLYGLSHFWLLPLYLALLVTGGISFIIGLVLLILFLHRYPKAQSKEGDF